MGREDSSQVGGDRSQPLSGGLGRSSCPEMMLDNELNNSYENEREDGTFPTSTQSQHPLLNEVILTNLFQYCSPDLMNTCRLVCKTWRDASLAGWRSSSTLLFSSWHDLDEPLPIQRFLNYVKEGKNKCGAMPFRNFHLMGWKFHTTVEEDCSTFDNEWVDAFIDLVGRHITNLELDCCTFGGIHDFRQVICGGCPNLENLVLNDIRLQDYFMEEDVNTDEDHDDHREGNNINNPGYETHVTLKSASVLLLGTFTHGTFPMTWLNFFSTFPNLTSFSLEASTCECCCANAYPRTTELFQAISTIRMEDSQKLPIKNFYIRPFINISKDLETQMIMSLIRELRIPLQSLSIMLEPELDNEIVKDVLKLHGRTLAKIIVKGTYCPSPPFPFGVQLDNLQELEIMPGLGRSLEFFQFAPLLRRICNISL